MVIYVMTCNDGYLKEKSLVVKAEDLPQGGNIIPVRKVKSLEQETTWSDVHWINSNSIRCIEIWSYKIPDKYFQYEDPELTDYLGIKGEGLRYKIPQEVAFEMGGSHLVVSLLSPYIRGFSSPYEIEQLRLFNVDLISRRVYAEIISQ